MLKSSMAMPVSTSANGVLAVHPSQKLRELIAAASRDYDAWAILLSEIETTCPEDVDTISLAYDSFMSLFPLCHWHLEKYAYLKAKLISPQEGIAIYERSMPLAIFSVGFWVDYFTFASSCFEDPEDVRRLFTSAMAFVEKDYLCHVLWDKYLNFELAHEGWHFLAMSYLQVLRFPTKKLQFYYDNFKQFVDNVKEEIGYDQDNGTAAVSGAASNELQSEIILVVKDLLGSSCLSVKFRALNRYRYVGEELYQRSCQMNDNIRLFEMKIQRHYFLETPLDDDQLKNWHNYLDFVEKQDDLDWTMKLYERCLIPCAKYPEFWMRCVEFLDSKGGHELAISALDRAANIYLKDVADIHIFIARFKEDKGDINGARSALLACDKTSDAIFVGHARALADLERRLGNISAARSTFEKAVEVAKETGRVHLLPSLYLQFSQLTLLISGSAAAAMDVLIEGVRNDCSLLVEEVIRFGMSHEEAGEVNVVEGVVGDAIIKLKGDDGERIWRLFIEFVSVRGSLSDVRRAWSRHVRLFPESYRKTSWAV